jgi:hypothetical protein
MFYIFLFCDELTGTHLYFPWENELYWNSRLPCASYSERFAKTMFCWINHVEEKYAKRPYKNRRLKWNNHSKQGTKFAIYIAYWGRRGLGRMVVGFTTFYTISAYHHERSGEAYSIPQYVTYNRSMVFTGYSDFLHQYNWPPRYSWHLLKVALATIIRTLYCLYIQPTVGCRFTLFVSACS